MTELNKFTFASIRYFIIKLIKWNRKYIERERDVRIIIILLEHRIKNVEFWFFFSI